VAVMAAGPTVGVPLAATLAVLFLAVKALGLSVLGGALGGRVLGALRGRPSPLTVEVFLGVAALLMVRFLPVVGEALWTVVVVVALGAAVFTLALVPELITVRASRS
jgi:hypothetical protein